MVSAAVAGLAMTAYGAYQKSEDEKKAKANVQPTYKIPQEEQDNLKQTEMLASQGMSQGSKSIYGQNADRALTASTSAILKGGGDANAIGSLYDKYNQGNEGLAIYDDKIRMQHMNDLVTQRARMGAFKDKAYQVNEYSPWANKAQAIAQQLAGDQNMMMSGVNMFGKGLGGMNNPYGGGGAKMSNTSTPSMSGGQNMTGMDSTEVMGSNWASKPMGGTDSTVTPTVNYTPFYDMDPNQEKISYANGMFSKNY